MSMSAERRGGAGTLDGMAAGSLATTVEELWELPDDGQRHELVDGELRVMEPAGARHGRVAARAGLLLGEHVRTAEIGVTFGAETGFILGRDPDTVRAPDAAFVARHRAEAVGDIEGYWPGAPDLAVEVVSPGDSFGEVESKALAWLEAGAAAVLVLDPDRRSATVYRPGGDLRVHGSDEELNLEDAVPGWRVGVAELFG
jgi:Uma2 family endonuclease